VRLDFRHTVEVVPRQLVGVPGQWYVAHGQKDIAEAGLGADLKVFRAGLAAVRRARLVVSLGQFNPALAAVAVPILDAGGEVRGSLTRFIAGDRVPVDGIEVQAPMLEARAQAIAARLPSARGEAGP
jgi:DNA-binding IclR family transcriptional regulator